MIVYILKFFPKLSEAFILDELCEMRRTGVPFRAWALGRWPEERTHREVESVIDRVEWLDDASPGKVAKAAALATLWARGPARIAKAYRLVGAKQRERFRYTFTQSMPRAAGLRRTAARHIHAHFADEAADHALCLSLLSGIPFSFTIHGSDLLVDPHPQLPFLAEHASAVLTPSRYNAAILEKFHGVPASKIEVVPNGVDSGRFRPGGEEEKTGRTILTVARLEAVKGLAHLVDAYGILAGRGVDFRAVIVGDGPERAGLEKQIDRLSLGDRVELTGDLPREEVSRRLRSADIFALSSLSEGLPVSALEAMSSALPVVAPDITGLPELVEDGKSGLLVPPKDPAALADALGRLLRDGELRRRMGRRGRSRVESGFSLARTVQRRREIFLP